MFLEHQSTSGTKIYRLCFLHKSITAQLYNYWIYWNDRIYTISEYRFLLNELLCIIGILYKNLLEL